MRTFIFYFLLHTGLYAQVGIGTTTPTASLDVNGTLRVRTVSNETDNEVIQDSILVISKSGQVNRIEATDVINAALPSMVRATFSGGGDIGLTLGSGTALVTFDFENIDSNDEFDTTTHTFTAKQAGIYQISAQVEISSGLSLSTNFGLGIYKNSVLIAEQRFANATVLGNSVSSPYRYVSTVVDLAENDTITFRVSSSALAASLNVSGTPTRSYCSVYQLR